MTTADIPCPRLERLVGSPRASLPQVLRARAEATPDAPFLTWLDRSWTYAEALAESERVAGFLRASGAAGERVASYTSNHPHAIWTWFGTQLAGGTYVPLNRSHRGRLLSDLIRRTEARVLLVEDNAVEEVLALGDLGVRTIAAAGDGPARHDGVTQFAEIQAATAWGGVTPQPHEIGMVMYTSGSTGRSKAVLLSQNQHCRGAGHIAESFELGPDDVWHGWAPLFHVFGQLYVVLGTLVGGGSVALRRRFTRSGFWREVDECGATLIGALANMWRLIWALPDDEHSRANPARLALVMGQCADIHHAIEERYAVRVIDCYGMTEAEPISLPHIGQPAGSHGRPSPDFEVAIVDQRDEILPTGQLGEIVARPRVPDVIFHGYEDDAERTVDAWRNLWFHTGDRGFLDADGYLCFRERNQNAIRRGGENVAAHEVELIVQRCPGVLAAAVVGIPTSPEEDDIKVTAVVASSAGLTPAQLHAWCVEEMAGFMVPRYVEFVDQLPVLDVGKVDTRALEGLGNGVWDAQAADG